MYGVSSIMGCEVWLHRENSSSGYQLISGKLMDNLVAQSSLFRLNSINFLTLPVNNIETGKQSYLVVLGPHISISQ